MIFISFDDSMKSTEYVLMIIVESCIAEVEVAIRGVTIGVLFGIMCDDLDPFITGDIRTTLIALFLLRHPKAFDHHREEGAPVAFMRERRESTADRIAVGVKKDGKSEIDVITKLNDLSRRSTLRVGDEGRTEREHERGVIVGRTREGTGRKEREGKKTAADEE